MTGSKGSGLLVNGTTLHADGLTVSGSAWEQSIDVSKGVDAEHATVLTLTNATLGDKLGIIEDIASAETPGTATVTVDGKQWGSYVHTYENNGTKYKQVYAANAALIGAVLGAPAYEYAPEYVYTGTMTTAVSEDGVTVAARYSLANVLDGTAMKDMARLLGALHWRDGGATVQSITYGGTVYTWANGENAVNLGSNWVKNPDETAGDGNTLISQIVDDFQAAAALEESIFPMELTLTGADGSTLKLTLDLTAE